MDSISSRSPAPQAPGSPAVQYSINVPCEICQERGYTSPLHDERGGPSVCLVCKGSWHAEHGKRRRYGRIVIRAIAAYLAAGGCYGDIDDLAASALGRDVGLPLDPLGFLDGTSSAGGNDIDLTSELLADVLTLVHPDRQPAERRELALRVTQALLEIKPHVYPAAKPAPPPKPSPEPCNGSTSAHIATDVDPLRFPCADCRATWFPYLYCTPCRAEWERRQQKERDKEAARRRALRKKHRMRRGVICAACDQIFRGKRKDARFCSAACRQRGHRAALISRDQAPPAAAREQGAVS